MHGHNIHIPVVGLAKKHEQLIIPAHNAKKYTVVSLSDDSPALHLLQHIRDEAHRFAKKYHVLLRKNSRVL